MSDNQRLAWERKYESHGQLWSRVHETWFQTLNPDRVLDLGCGSGKSSATLKGDVVSVDFSMKALRMASDFVPSLSPVCCDVRHIPFVDSSFDFVNASYIFGHLDESARTRAIREVARVLKPGGHVAIEVFSVADSRFSRRTAFPDYSDVQGDGIFHYYFSKEDLEALLSGFEIEFLDEVRWAIRIGPGEAMPRSAIRALARKARAKNESAGAGI